MIVDQQTIPTVPPARLGALLSARRTELGLTIEELSSQSNGSLSVDDLTQAEHGRHLLGNDFLTRITELYECRSGSVVPIRYRLIVDLDRGEIVTGSSSTNLPRTSPTEILERYLAFVYLMRDKEPGTKMNLRDQDIEVLSQVLELSESQVKSCLASMMNSDSVKTRTLSIRKQISVSTVGLLVGFTTIGALILTPETSAASAEAKNETTSTKQESLTGAGPQIERSATTVENLGHNTTVEESQTQEFSTEHASGADSKHDTDPNQSEQLAGPEITAAPEQSGQLAGPEITAAPEQSGQLAGPEITAAPSRSNGDSQSVSLEAEALINYDWQTHLPGWNITYEQADPYYRGMTNRATKTISIGVRPGDSATDVADVLAHELGHAIDLEYLSDNDRLRWLESRGLPEVWWVSDGYSDFSAGQGDFAEAVAAVLIGSPSASTHGEFTPKQLKLANSLLPR